MACDVKSTEELISVNLAELKEQNGYQCISESELIPNEIFVQINIRDNIIRRLASFMDEFKLRDKNRNMDLDCLKLKIIDLNDELEKERSERTSLSKKLTKVQAEYESLYNQWNNYYQSYCKMDQSVLYKPIRDDIDSINDLSVHIAADVLEPSRPIRKVKQVKKPILDSNDVDVIDIAYDGDGKKLALKVESLLVSDNPNKCDLSALTEDLSVVEESIPHVRLVVDDIIVDMSDDDSVDRVEMVDKYDCLASTALDADSCHDSVVSSTGWDCSLSISDQVQAAAGYVVDLQSSGYTYHAESGLYYHGDSGYYYDSERKLFYDSSNGRYFLYNDVSGQCEFHSQMDISNLGVGGRCADQYEMKKKEQKRTRKQEKKSQEGNYGSQDEPTASVSKDIEGTKKMETEIKEEGECSDTESETEDSQQSEEEIMEWKESIPEVPDLAVRVAPSLRLMVVESESDRVPIGGLHLVTVNGGTIGREAYNLVQLADLSVSKTHAEILYRSLGVDDHHYFVTDIGSNNGTFVNNVRLSEPHCKSGEVELGHRWQLRCGPITLQCHIHPGTMTCNECEPGIVAAAIKSAAPAVNTINVSTDMETNRRREAKALRKKYALTWGEEPLARNAKYDDRSATRRQTVGSDNPYEKTETASVHVPVVKQNKGYTMLQKMGWEQGQGIGKTAHGIIEPITADGVVGRAGLGSNAPIPLETTTREIKKQKEKEHILAMTQHRFQKGQMKDRNSDNI